MRDPAVLARYPEREEALCWQHLAGPEAWREASQRGARATIELKRSRKVGRPRSGLNPEITLDEVYALARDGLAATFDDAGLPGQVDWTTRLLSLLVILTTFPRQERKTHEAARQLLERVLPAETQEDPHAKHRLKVESVYREARRQWDKLRLRVDRSPLTRLYVEEYPPFLIAPWESREAVLKERPEPIPADDPQVERLQDGSGYVLRRDGELPLLVKSA